jgi:hypothetical protein
MPGAASPLGSTSTLDTAPAPSSSDNGPAQPSGVAASSPNALGSALNDLDQLLNGMDDSLSQAGPSASGE